MKSKEEIKQEFFNKFGNESFRGYPLEQCNAIWNFFEQHIESKEDIKPLLKELFGLWEGLAEVGEIKIGGNFNKKYEELKSKINKQY